MPFFRKMSTTRRPTPPVAPVTSTTSDVSIFFGASLEGELVKLLMMDSTIYKPKQKHQELKTASSYPKTECKTAASRSWWQNLQRVWGPVEEVQSPDKSADVPRLLPGKSYYLSPRQPWRRTAWWVVCDPWKLSGTEEKHLLVCSCGAGSSEPHLMTKIAILHYMSCYQDTCYWQELLVSIIRCSSSELVIGRLDPIKSGLETKNEKIRSHRDLNSGYWIQSPMS